MATVFGANYTSALVTVPPARIHQGEWGGKERTMIDTYTMTADAANGDIVLLGRLPAGAKVLGARVFGADLGGTGTLKLGNSASVDGTGSDALAAASFITAADSSGQAWDVSDGASATMRGAAIGLVRFIKEVNIMLTFVGVTSGATGVVITSLVKYIVD